MNSVLFINHRLSQCPRYMNAQSRIQYVELNKTVQVLYVGSLNSGISLYSEKCTVLRGVRDWIESELSWERFVLARADHNMPQRTGTTMARAQGSWPPNYCRARGADGCLSTCCVKGATWALPGSTRWRGPGSAPALPMKGPCYGSTPLVLTAPRPFQHPYGTSSFLAFTPRPSLSVSLDGSWAGSSDVDSISHVWSPSGPAPTACQWYTLLCLIKALGTRYR